MKVTSTITGPRKATASSVLATSPGSRVPALRRIKGVVVGLLLALIASLGIGAATVAPAHAASYVQGCFRSATPGMGFAGTRVQLQYWNGGSWTSVWFGNLSSNGCASVNISGSLRNYYVQLVVSERVGSAYFYGVTPYYALPGTLRVDLGTGTVTCRGCL